MLCVEGLSNAIDRADREGSIHGCLVSPTTPTISHLPFADGSFLFFRGTLEEAAHVKSLLVNYEKCSGQSVNFQKSGVFYSANVRRDLQQQLSTVLGVCNDLASSKYLGAPLSYWAF